VGHFLHGKRKGRVKEQIKTLLRGAEKGTTKGKNANLEELEAPKNITRFGNKEARKIPIHRDDWFTRGG